MGVEKVVYKSVPEKEKICLETIPKTVEAPKGIGVRHLQAFLLFITICLLFGTRAQLSVSMVAMTANKSNNCALADKTTAFNRTEINYNIDSKENETYKIKHTNNCTEENTSISKWSVYQTYDWHKSTQEMILFAFFVGYTAMMIPVGIIAQKYGGKRPILFALLVNGIISIVTPWVAMVGGWIGVCICRLLMGMSQSALYPSCHTMLAKWAPLSERGRLSTYVYTGSQFGTICIFQIAGVFAGIPSLGWPSIFWLCGGLKLVCFGLFMWLVVETPYDHPNITVEELLYITGDGCGADSGTKKRKTPWKYILTSSAVWGIVVTHAGSGAGYLLVLTQTPTYMSKVLNVDIKRVSGFVVNRDDDRNGFYSSLPYISMYIVTLAFGHLSDFLIKRKIMSVVNVRRTANTIGMAVSGLFLIAFGFAENTMLALTLLITCLGLHSGVHVGFHINQIDLAPNFAGPIMSIGNMCAALTGLLVPVLVSNVIKDDVTNQHRWQIVFIIVAAIKIITNTVYVVFAKGTVQPWNFYGIKDDAENKHQDDDAAQKEEKNCYKDNNK